MNQTNEAKVIPLHQLYISILVQVATEDKLQVVQQEIDQDNGRLWLCSTGTTVPLAMLSYQFAIDDVQFEVQTRDERKISRKVAYAGGIDGFVQEFQKFLQSHRLTAKPDAKRGLTAAK